MMERIVYLDRSVLRTAVRRPAFEHEWIEYATSRPEAVKARLEGATIAITHRVFLKGEDLPPTLGLIAVGATGAEPIDLAACRARGVHVCNVRGWSASVSEHFFALALALRRNLLAYHSAGRIGGAGIDSLDLALASCVDLALDLASQPAYRDLIKRWVVPNGRMSPETAVEFVRQSCSSYLHPVGTCPMGTGREAVVDNELRVRGALGLRISDASVMPTIPSANTNAPSIMIGEFASRALVAGRAAALAGAMRARPAAADITTR